MDTKRLEGLVENFIKWIDLTEQGVGAIEIFGGRSEDGKYLCEELKRHYNDKLICYNKFSTLPWGGVGVHRIDLSYFENHKSKIS